MAFRMARLCIHVMHFDYSAPLPAGPALFFFLFTSHLISAFMGFVVCLFVLWPNECN